MRRADGRTNAELLTDVIAELHRLAVDGFAPSTRQWDTQRGPHVPSETNLRARFGMTFNDIVKRAGLQPHGYRAPKGGKVVTVSMGEQLEHHVAAGAELADWNSRYHAALHVLPTPTRRETVQGRTISGEPCVIYREYFLVR